MTRLAFFLAALPAFAQSPAPRYSVAGAVINAVSHQPVPRTRLTLQVESHPEMFLTTVSGDAGEFAFPQVPAGHYQLIAERRGFTRQTYGQKSLSNSLASAVIAGPGLDTAHLRFLLIPPASISGRVTDDAGDPVPNATVQLFRASVISGMRHIMGSSQAFTDELGHYTIDSLSAGSYYVVVTGSPWYADRFTDSPFARTAYAITFFPHATDPSSAVAIKLGAGQDETADVVLPTVTGASITLHGPPAGPSASGQPAMLFCSLAAGAPGGANLYDQNINVPGDTCTFRDVPPGHYRVTASRNLNPGDFHPGSPIDVNGTDLDVSLTTPPVAPSISGTVIFTPATAHLDGSTYVLLREESDPYATITGIGADGSFSFPAIAPGRYRLGLYGSRGVFLGSLSAEGAPLVNGLLDLNSAPSARLTLTAAPANARLRGFVYQAGKPLPAAFVLLAPTTPTTDPADYLSYQTESDGSFDFTNLPPGNYLVFALPDGSNLEYANPAVIRPFLAKATPVTLVANQPRDIKIEVLARP